jgi:DNA-binding response OmpR family regulator
MKESLRVLLVEDESSLRVPLARYLHDEYDYEVDAAGDADTAWSLVKEGKRPYDVALIDDTLAPKEGGKPRPLGIELMGQIKKRCPETECIIFTQWGLGRAAEALEEGAYLYIEKPFRAKELGITIRVAAQRARIRRERALLSNLLEISGAMVRETETDTILATISDAVPKLTGANACAMAWTSPLTNRIEYSPITGLGDPDLRWRRHFRDVELTKSVIATGEPYIVADVDATTLTVDPSLRRAGPMC